MNTNRYLVTFKRTLIEHVSFEVVAENDLEAGDLAEQHLNAGLHNAEWSADEPAKVEIVDCEQIAAEVIS